MRNARRFMALFATVVALSTGTVILTSRAADQTQQPSTPATNTAAGASKPTAAKPPIQGAPQVPEESATLRDDPTIAPDPKQSADNSVSFPNDI